MGIIHRREARYLNWSRLHTRALLWTLYYVAIRYRGCCDELQGRRWWARGYRTRCGYALLWLYVAVMLMVLRLERDCGTVARWRRAPGHVTASLLCYICGSLVFQGTNGNKRRWSFVYKRRREDGFGFWWAFWKVCWCMIWIWTVFSRFEYIHLLCVTVVFKVEFWFVCYSFHLLRLRYKVRGNVPRRGFCLEYLYYT